MKLFVIQRYGEARALNPTLNYNCAKSRVGALLKKFTK